VATRAWLGSALALLASAFLLATFMVAARAFLDGDPVVFNPENPMLRLDRYASFAVALLAVGSLLGCLIGVGYLAEHRMQHGEYYALLLLATSGMAMLVSATDLITLFLGIEIMSLPIYVLAGFDRASLRGNESALKYFVTGSTASALMLYGMALLYGATGHTDFDGIRASFDGGMLARAGLGLLLVGFVFKISAVPLHQWTPDVYEGAPTSVTAYMSVTVKIAAFAALVRVVGPGASAPEALGDVLGVVAALTMIVGNFMAVIQQSVKRMLAYSSVSHSGYLLLGVVAGTEPAHAAVLFYLLGYVFTNLGAFAVLVALTHRGRDVDRIEGFAGLAGRRPALAAVLTLFMLSLAGIPGTVGFIGKFQLFGAAVNAGEVPLTVVAVLTSLVSVYYYLRIPVAMYMREPGDQPGRTALASLEWLVLALCTLFVLLLGFFPNGAPFGALSWVRALEWARDAAAALAF